MKQRTLIIAATIFTALIFTISISAQNKTGTKRMGKEFGLKKLNLTEAQQSQVEKLRIEHQKNMVDLQANLKKQEIALEEVTANKDLKRSDLTNAIENISKAKDQIALARANHFMDVYQILDNTQKAQWLKMGKRMMMMKSMKDKHGRMMGRKMMMKNNQNMPAPHRTTIINLPTLTC